MTLHRRLSLSVAGALLAAVPLAPCGAEDAAGLQAVRVTASVAELLDPDAAVWKDRPPAVVAIEAQTAVTPYQPQPAVVALTVKSAHNGQWMAFLIEWADKTKNDLLVLDRFGDQVAVELPNSSDPAALPSPMMGDPDGAVTIMQWRAAFQRDIDTREPAMRDLYPFAHVDIYPDEILRASDARPYLGAVGVENPISRAYQTPVLDQVARGWGSLTVKPAQHAKGRGLWRTGNWYVVIAHPLDSEGEHDPQLAPGGQTSVAFAVWDGGAQEVGPRKGWSNWVPLSLAP